MSSKQISILSLFIAISVVGGLIKIPAVVGSIALDLFPALMAAVYLGRRSGAIVAGLGHLASAFIAGLPLGPIHLIVALSMALIVSIFEIIYVKGKQYVAGIFVVLANTVLAPLPLLIFFSFEFILSLIPALFLASSVNSLIAILLIPRFKPIVQRI